MSLYDQLAALPAKERDGLLRDLGYVKKRAAAPKSNGVIDSLFPIDAISQGPSSSELEAWLTSHHDFRFRVKYRQPRPSKPAKLSAGQYQQVEAAWNDQARRLWKERGIEA